MQTELMILLIIMVIALVAAMVYMFYDWKVNYVDFRVQMKVGGWKKFAKASAVTFVTLFFDPIGIGANGPTTAGWKFFKVCRDKQIPGTIQTYSLIYTTAATGIMVTSIDVDFSNLIGVIIAAGVGAAVGGPLVSRLNLSKLRLYIGICLIFVAIIIVLRTSGILGDTTGNTLTGVYGWKLAVMLIVAFIFGALMMIGVGIYAPMMCTVALLGMSGGAAYPLMMGTCVLLVPIGSIVFIRESIHAEIPAYDRKVTVAGNTFGFLGGMCGTWVILTIIDTLDVSILLYFIACVIVVLSALMIYQGLKKQTDALADAEDEEFTRLKAEWLEAHPEYADKA